MWILIWLQVSASTGVEHFQLGRYGTLPQCRLALAKAEVMVTTNDTKVVCIQLGIGSDE